MPWSLKLWLIYLSFSNPIQSFFLSVVLTITYHHLEFEVVSLVIDWRVSKVSETLLREYPFEICALSI